MFKRKVNLLGCWFSVAGAAINNLLLPGHTIILSIFNSKPAAKRSWYLFLQAFYHALKLTVHWFSLKWKNFLKKKNVRAIIVYAFFSFCITNKLFSLDCAEICIQEKVHNIFLLYTILFIHILFTCMYRLLDNYILKV